MTRQNLIKNELNSNNEDTFATKENEKVLSLFNSITNSETKVNVIEFLESVVATSKKKNYVSVKMQTTFNDKKLLKKMCESGVEDLHYIALFSKYISNMESVVLKEKLMSLIKTFCIKN